MQYDSFVCKQETLASSSSWFWQKLYLFNWISWHGIKETRRSWIVCHSRVNERCAKPTTEKISTDSIPGNK